MSFLFEFYLVFFVHTTYAGLVERHFAVTEDTPTTLVVETLGRSSADGLVPRIAQFPLNGRLEKSVENSRIAYLYTPNSNYVGRDHFRIELFDSSGIVRQKAKQSIFVQNRNDIPMFENFSASVYAGTPITINLAEYLVDADSDTLTITASADSDHRGRISISDYDLTFDPYPGFVGQDTVQINISDGNGGEVLGEIIFDVQPLSSKHDVHLRFHVEEVNAYEETEYTPRGAPRTDWVADPTTYEAKLINFLSMEASLHDLGVHIDFMGSSSFWQAARMHTSTYALHDGMNLALYLQSRGHGVYVHDHGNYAECAYYLEQLLGTTVSGVIGGFRTSALSDYFSEIVTLRPSLYSFLPTILTGAVNSEVGHEANYTGRGIWCPESSGIDSILGDCDQIVYVGGGTDTITQSLEVAAAVGDGSSTQIYTTTAIMMDYEDLYTSNDEDAATVLAGIYNILDAGNGYTRFVNVEESVSYWRTELGAVSTQTLLEE